MSKNVSWWDARARPCTNTYDIMVRPANYAFSWTSCEDDGLYGVMFYDIVLCVTLSDELQKGMVFDGCYMDKKFRTLCFGNEDEDNALTICF